MKKSELKSLIRKILKEQVGHSGGPASHTMGGSSGGGTSLPPQAEACQAMAMMSKNGGRNVTRGKFWSWLTGIFKCKNPAHGHGGSADFDDSGDWVDGYNPGGGGL